MGRTRRTATGPLLGISYARQSLTRDKSESRENQVEINAETADRHGVQLVATLIEPESTSAYKNRGQDRPRWKDLLEMIRSGTAQVVVVYKTDRVTRGGGPGWAPLLEAAEAAGLDLDRFILTPAGYMSEFEIGIRATTDREESKKTGDRIADMKYRHAREGRPNGGGRRPFGFTDAQFSAHNEEEATLLRELRDRAFAGEGMQTLAKDLNRRGLRTPGKGVPWTGQHLGRILRGAHLAGLRQVTEPYMTADGHQRYRQIDLVPGQWVGIWSREDYEKLNAIKGTAWSKVVKRHLLTGILECGTCGSKMSSKPHSLYGLRYECRRRSKQIEGVNVTGCVTITGGDVEYVVKEALLKRLDSPTVRAELAASTQGATGRALTKEMAAVKARLEEATEDYYATPPRISRAQFLKASETLNTELEELSARLSRQRVTVAIPKTSAGIRKAYEEGDIEFRRALLSAGIAKVIIKPAQPHGQAEMPIDVPGKVRGRPVDAARIVPIWRG